MSADLSNKLQNTVWWITSIAISVVCCSVIFVLFASYFVDVKADIKEGNMRIHAIEEREDRILSELQQIRKHGLPPMPVADAPAAAPAAADTVPTSLAPAAVGVGQTPEKAPTSFGVDIQSTLPATPSVPAAPSVSVTPVPVVPPAMVPSPEKK